MSGKRVVRAELVLQDGTKIKINCPPADLAKAIAGLTGNSQPTQAHTALADRIAKGDKSALTELAGQCAVTPGASVPGTVITAPRASDPKVVHIQETLNGLGLRKGVTDGVIDKGGSTERALGRLDIKVERGQDGSVSNLDAITQGVDNAKRVQDMQKALNTGCGTKLATDGDFGAQTREAALKVIGIAEEAAKKKADSPAKTAELEALGKARTDLAGNDKKIDASTLETVQKAATEHGPACKAANQAVAPVRQAAAPAAEQPAAGRRPAKPEPQPQRQRTAQTGVEAERPQQRGGTRQGTPANLTGSMPAIGTGRFISGDAPNHIYSEHTGRRSAQRQGTARHEQFTKMNEVVDGPERMEAARKLAARTQRTGSFDGGAEWVQGEPVFASDVRSVNTPLGSRLYGKGGAKADGDDTGQGVGGTGSGRAPSGTH